MVAVDYVLRRTSLLLGADGDGHPVFVRPSYEKHVLLLQAEVAHVDVSRHVDACQMADMHRSVGVGQCRGDGCPFEFLFHICLFLLDANDLQR